MSENYQKKILESYIKTNGFVRKIQIDSYDFFITEGIQQIIDESEPIIITYKENNKIVSTYEIKFEKVSLSKPILKENDGTQSIMYPNMCRTRNLSYMSAINCEISIKITRHGTNGENIETISKCKEIIGYIPVMVRSKLCMLNGLSDTEIVEKGECLYDEGGYFIIKGGEKVIVSQERMSNNMVFCFYKKYNRVVWSAEIRANYDYNLKTQNAVTVKLFTSNIHDDSPREIRVELPYIRPEIPLFILFNAIGYSYDEAMTMIMETCEGNTGLSREYIENILLPSCIEYRSLTNDNDPNMFQENALIYIGQRKYNASEEEKFDIGMSKNNSYAMSILVNSMFSHIVLKNGLEPDYSPKELRWLFKQKSYFLCYMLCKLMQANCGIKQEDDRDHLSSKRMDTTGALLSYLFKINFKRMKRETQSIITKTIESNCSFNLTTAIKQKTLTNSIKYSISTGNWGFQTGSTPPKIGVSQVLSRLTYNSYLSHLRRVNTPINKEGKLSKPRQLHTTTIFYLCPIETPEGQGCGLIKNYSITAHVSNGSKISQRIIREYLEKNLDQPTIGTTKVLLDGFWVGNTDKPIQITRTLKSMRRDLTIDSDVSIAWLTDENEIQIYTCCGRCLRPLIVADMYNETMKFIGDTIKQTNCGPKWIDFLKYGYIEYIDPLEEETTLIAMYPSDVEKNPNKKYTHIEIDPCTMLGVSAGTIPHPEHIQAPRSIYQSSMSKQSLGLYALNYNKRFDTFAHVLSYPQKPIVSTNILNLLHGKEFPSGTNAVLAIQCYTGYNQEDSIIMNQSAIDRGFFRSVYLKTYVDQEKESARSSQNSEIFADPKRPDLTVKGFGQGSYTKLDSDGIIKPGTKIHEDDIIIGKIAPIIGVNAPNGAQIYKDSSTSIKEPGTVDKVIISTNHDGYKLTKIRVASVRRPEIGDKFASRNAQKGTMGLTLRQEDMPYTQEGIVPDIIMNPHAIPSRMTIGHIIEMLEGILFSMTGKEPDGSPFQEDGHDKVTVLCNKLEKLGFQKYGMHQLYNGFTGEMIPSMIYMGPIYYQRLKHMVQDKMHCLTLDHEVLTKDGWKSYFQLTETDQIACLQNGKLVYNRPNAILYYPEHEGSMYEIKGPGIDLKVTLEHRMYVKVDGSNSFQLIKAQDVIFKNVEYKNDAEWSSPVDMGISRTLFDGWMTMKTIPNWVFEWDKQNVYSFLTVLFNENNGKITGPKTYIDQITHLCLHAGLSYEIIQIPLHPLHKIPYYENTSLIRLIDPIKILSQNCTEKISHEKIPVFCLEVPGEVFYVRRNGIAIWTGNSRSHGPVTKLTRQPVEGRNRAGGLRFGEMERDALISYGSASMLQDRLFYNSDMYRIHVCDLCGLIAQADLENQRFLCKCTKPPNRTQISQVYLPYACKLLFQELMAMNIAPRMILG